MIIARTRLITSYLSELFRHGVPEVVGPLDREVIFLADGVGGFQSAPIMIRKVFRELDEPVGTIVYRWQFGVPGEIWTDLMCLRRNRVMAAKLARKILAFRRENPNTKIHLLGYSGGGGIATFACEQLRGRRVIDTLILACPALSSHYNLAPALRAVTRAYVFVSHRDSVVLGAGTWIFGTIDRVHGRSAGMSGFKRPAGLSAADRECYDRCREIWWDSSLRSLGHYGGHAGWGWSGFLKPHLLPILCGEPLLPALEVKPACEVVDDRAAVRQA